MPNTLAHLGLQPLLTRAGLPGADLKWIWLGCVLPDLPWIAQRTARLALPDISGLDLRLYAAVQSSLFVSLVLAAALAALSRRPRSAFAILAAGIVLHLLLDATQTKWANGVLLFAPFSWDLLNFGLYWPEEWPTKLLTGFGAGYVVWALLRERPAGVRPIGISRQRWLAASGLGAVYLALPLLFLGAAEQANLHHVGTLRDVEARHGAAIEIDRSIIEWRDGVAIARLSLGPELVLVGEVPQDAERMSIRGTFIDPDTVMVNAAQVHTAGWRSAMSYVGLLVVVAWWIAALLRRRVDSVSRKI